MNAKEYSNELYSFWIRQKEGPGQALKIAKRHKATTLPSNWMDLPLGPVFGTKGWGSERWDLNKKSLEKTHNFWIEVVGLLEKRFK